jgi:Na+-transporting methylmalonyl-CoA/oxaloacetate decarboxylase gamma subunit
MIHATKSINLERTKDFILVVVLILGIITFFIWLQGQSIGRAQIEAQKEKESKKKAKLAQ